MTFRYMMKNNMMGKVISLVLTVTLAATVFVGCGSSGSSGGEAGSKDGLKKVNIVSPTSLASMDLCWIYAADGLGFFKDEGIEVNMIESTDGSDPKILGSGQADFGAFSPSVGLTAVQSGVDNVEGICNVVAYNMFGIAVNKTGGIKDWSDLTGKQIGFVADTASSLYDPILKAAGVDPSSVSYVNYGTSEYEALNTDQVPAMGTWLSEYYMCEGMGYDWDYLSGNDVLPQMANSLWVNTDYAKKNPEIVKKVVKAVTKAMYACYYNPEAVADITLVKYPSIEITWDGAVGAVKGNAAGMFGIEESEQQKNIDEKQIGVYDTDVVKQTIENLKTGGALTEDMDYASHYTNDYTQPDIDYSEVEKVCDSYEFQSKVKQISLYRKMEFLR